MEPAALKEGRELKVILPETLLGGCGYHPFYRGEARAQRDGGVDGPVRGPS